MLAFAQLYTMLCLDERDGHLPAYNSSRMKLAGHFVDISLVAVVFRTNGAVSLFFSAAEAATVAVFVTSEL